VFLLLEDEHGMSNAIVPPDVYSRDRIAVRAEPLLEVTGRLERREGTINVLAERITALSHQGRAEIGPAPAETPDVGELRAAAPYPNSFGRGRR
jgi:DNA polymerase III alpha subunit